MNPRLKISLNYGFWMGCVLSIALHAFGFFPIVIGILLGMLIVTVGYLLKNDDDVAKALREIELTNAKIEILEELKK